MKLSEISIVIRISSFKETCLKMSSGKWQPFCLSLNVLKNGCLLSLMMKAMACMASFYLVITLRPGQNGRHFPDDIFKCIFLNENVWISIEISLKFVPRGPINNIPALVQIMACHLVSAKPLSEPMMVSLLTHISMAQCKTAVSPLLTHLRYCSLALSRQCVSPIFNELSLLLLINNEGSILWLR